MLSGGTDNATLARDTVFAAVMIILTGIIGLCLLLGGARFREQIFGRHGVSAALVTLTAITILTLILPNYTTSVPGPLYSKSQLVFVAIVSLVLYGTFVMVQVVRHVIISSHRKQTRIKIFMLSRQRKEPLSQALSYCCFAWAL